MKHDRTIPMDASEVQLAACLYCRARQKTLCGGCELTELRSISQLKGKREYSAGETIFRPGDRPHFTGIVVEGTVSVGYALPNGDERIVRFLTEGNFFGRTGGQPVPYCFRAETDVRVCAFDQQDFENSMQAMPAMEAQLRDILIKEIDASREMIAWLSGPDARQKLTLYLVHLCEQQDGAVKGNAGPVRITFPATQGMVANHLGVTRWSFSREMSWLRSQGIISSSGHRTVIVHRPDRLIDIASSGRSDRNKARPALSGKGVEAAVQ
ncbi:Crp/Fnr family transcriptional regulator [Paracoccus sp. CPCC 101403]|uniref:Crp/Fnr family transcriptional regulator n=1 Tax=Paracoccus broussonetiae TaxID=3075834 RepID=A0ABU3EAW5_9RHOB|nr:Crp/Fnr family transcriptional regulator [Paracoccus sp. CPCC 101403]MDT1061012.1 Crp/Fnr family transcriptional regulator [Paracoccus sp. CPCC 101403]